MLGGGILEELLDKTGVEKSEIDGLVLAGLTGTGAANPFWAQTTAERAWASMSVSASRFTPAAVRPRDASCGRLRRLIMGCAMSHSAVRRHSRARGQYGTTVTPIGRHLIAAPRFLPGS